MADMQRLLKRGDTYHYHRRVPLHLVDIVGKKFVRRALGTDSPKEARRRRTLEDARTAYVRETVEEMDRKASERLALSPPADKRQLADMVEDAQVQLGILTNPGDPRQDEFVATATDRIAHAHGADLTDAALVLRPAKPPFHLEAVAHVECKQGNVDGTCNQFQCLHKIEARIELP